MNAGESTEDFSFFQNSRIVVNKPRIRELAESGHAIRARGLYSNFQNHALRVFFFITRLQLKLPFWVEGLSITDKL